MGTMHYTHLNKYYICNNSWRILYVKTPLCMKTKHDQTYTKALLIDLQIFKWSSRKKQTKKKIQIAYKLNS